MTTTARTKAILGPPNQIKNQGSWDHYHKSEGFGKKSSAWQGWHDDSDNEMRSSQTKKKRELDLPVDF